MRPVRELLVVELLGGFGDLLIALPAIHALARSHPDAQVTVLTFAPGDVLLRHDPHVHEVVVATDHREGAPRALVDDVLARRAWDLAVTTSTYDGIADACRRAARVAVTNLWRGAPDGELVDRRFLRLLLDAGVIDPAHVDTPLQVHLLPDEVQAGEARLRAAGLAPDRERVLLVPSAGMPVKEWPVRRWAELAGLLQERGVSVGTVGAAGAEPVPGTVLLPPTDLLGLTGTYAALAASGGAVVGADTGPVRLATAAGARAVILFGASPAGRYGLAAPLGTNLQGLPSCPVRQPSSVMEQECWWEARCPLADAPACMDDLSVGDVLDSTVQVLDFADRGRSLDSTTSMG